MSELSNRPTAGQPASLLPDPRKAWLTYAEAGALVGLSRVTLWKLIGAGEVKAARVGRAVRIDRESLTTYMERATENAAG